MRVDFLIAGQGLAGSLLGWELLRRGAQVLLLDRGASNASRVAAGLINPITGIRLVKTEEIEMLLPLALQYYRQLQQHFGQPFYIEKPLLRMLANAQERQYSERRCADPTYRNYIDQLNPASDGAPFGSLRQKQTGYLLIAALLDNLRTLFYTSGALRTTELAYGELEISNDAVQWRDVEARRLIFCEGHSSRNNPWFSWLPLQPVKGEILTLRGAPLPESIINYGQWLIPLDNKTFRIGATFHHERLDNLTTEQAKRELLDNFAHHCPQIEVTDILAQQAGVRPTTLDKQPFLGAHPRLPPLAIFNGFGAKGSLSIPYYARRFADYLLHGAALPANADIRRHAAAYFPG